MGFSCSFAFTLIAAAVALVHVQGVHVHMAAILHLPKKYSTHLFLWGVGGRIVL